MIYVFNTHFGQDDAGMVGMEILETGKRKRPKGINILSLLAYLLDPRMKGGVTSPESRPGLALDSDWDPDWEKILVQQITGLQP